MDPGSIMALAGAVFFLCLGGFAALTTAQALGEGDGEGLGRRVFTSLTRTTFFLGLPGLIGFLMFLKSESTGGGGIMSGSMGLVALFVLGFLALISLWTAAITMGFVATLVLKNLSPRVAAGVMAVFIAGAPLLAASMYATAAYEAEMKRRGHR